MGLKYENLKQLTNRGLNTFEYIHFDKCETFIEDIKNYITQNQSCTFRGDHKTLKYDLPFLAVDNGNISDEEIIKYVQKCTQSGCTIISSNGKKYDEIQLANIVVQIDNNQIIIEASEQKVPLRIMYKHPENLCVYTGMMFDSIKNYIRTGKILEKVYTSDLERVLNKIFEVKKPNETYFELTLYPEKVGILKENIIFWQIN